METNNLRKPSCLRLLTFSLVPVSIFPFRALLSSNRAQATPRHEPHSTKIIGSILGTRIPLCNSIYFTLVSFCLFLGLSILLYHPCYISSSTEGTYVHMWYGGGTTIPYEHHMYCTYITFIFVTVNSARQAYTTFSRGLKSWK